MTLVLTVLRCPEAVPPETRHVQGGEFSIGRGPDNGWVLADPDRHLSKRHCVLAFRAGGWQLADVSTNGTFLNRETEPVGQGRPRALRDGDRLHLGAYEIEVRLTDEAAPTHGPTRTASDDPFGEDPFQPPAGAFASADPFGDAPSSRIGGQQVQLPADFDPLGPEPDEEAFTTPTQADHNPSLEDAFRAPQPAGSLLPDDWDLDLTPKPAAPAAPVAAPPPRTPAAPAPPPEDPLDLAPAPPPAAPPPLRQAMPAEDAGLLAGFLGGAGMPEASPADPAATMEELGRAFRVLVAGLRRTLIARAAIKGEFRIEQTMIRSRGNNPLKFSAGDDDALAALLGAGRRVDMTPSAAIAEALSDIRLHELATMAAMQSAVRALLAQLDPAPLRREAEQGSGLSLVPAQRKGRAWDAFEKLHARISQALADDFDSVFGKAFARAYEEALHEVSGREGEP